MVLSYPFTLLWSLLPSYRERLVSVFLPGFLSCYQHALNIWAKKVLELVQTR